MAVVAPVGVVAGAAVVGVGVELAAAAEQLEVGAPSAELVVPLVECAREVKPAPGRADIRNRRPLFCAPCVQFFNRHTPWACKR